MYHDVRLIANAGTLILPFFLSCAEFFGAGLGECRVIRIPGTVFFGKNQIRRLHILTFCTILKQGEVLF